MKTDVTAKYLVSIVLIVALVGFVSLLANSGATLVGATTSSTCSDTDSSTIPTINLILKGKVSGGLWKTTNKAYTLDTDYCNPKGSLVEYFCSDSTHAFSTTQSCATKVGTGSVCSAGACTAVDSDGDGVVDTSDVCPGYDDKVDTDSDGTPDGCDTFTDSDGDGVADGDDVCAGYDDTVDTDSDGTPDGCDTDDDGDGYSDADETAAGTDPLNASDYPIALPDLVLDESQTSVSFSGEVFVASGTVYDSDVDYTYVFAVKNQGTATASGTSYNNVYFYYGGSAAIGIGDGWSSTLALATGDTETRSTSKTITTPTAGALALFQELYTAGSAVVDAKYRIDYATTKYITESDETNNDGTVSVTVTASGLTFTEVECRSDSDCPVGCGCSTTDYNCYETYTSGSSTYTSTTPC